MDESEQEALSDISDDQRSHDVSEFDDLVYERNGFDAQERRSVRVGPTPVGKGVFARRHYPATAIVGEITGEFIDDPTYSSEYCIEIDSEMSLEPAAPFRFLNHSCDPNCEFDFWEPEAESDVENGISVNERWTTDSHWLPEILLFSLRNIEQGEELTIDYNWPASFAIRCRCGAPTCRGWVVAVDALDEVEARE